MALSQVLARVPGLGGFEAANEINRNAETNQLQQAGMLQAILQKQQAMQVDAQMRQMVAQSGGDPEKAMQLALQNGNVLAASKLEPLVKLYQQKKIADETAAGLSQLYGGQTAPPGAPPADAMPAPQGTPPPAPVDPRQTRLDHLKKMAVLYARNPTMVGTIQKEIDKIESEKPMVEHNFPVGDNMVQPHISHDQGKTWKPIEGSKPSAKFAKQVVNVNTGAEAPTITADTLEMDAYRYLTDGTLPPNMGRGVQGAKQATEIRNRAAQLAKDAGMSADEIRFAQLTNKAQVSAIMQLGRARAQILQAEKLASSNADLAVEASNASSRTGVPLLNKGIQWAQENLQGDENLRKFTAANETFISEYAKVMGGGYGAAAPTEGAQARAHTILNRATTQSEYRAAVNQLRLEMKNRVKSLDDQMSEERKRLRSSIGKPTKEETPSSTPPAEGGWKITPVQ